MSLEIISGITQLKQPEHNQSLEEREPASVTASGNLWGREPGDSKGKRHNNLKYIKYFIRRIAKTLTGTKEKILPINNKIKLQYSRQDEKDLRENSDILEDKADGKTKINFPTCEKLSVSEENTKSIVEENVVEEQKLIVPGKYDRKKRMKRILLHLANVHGRKIGKTSVCTRNTAGDDVLGLGEFSEEIGATEERTEFLDVAGNLNVSDEDTKEICCKTRTGEEGNDEAVNKDITGVESLDGGTKFPADSVKIEGGTRNEDTENERITINEGAENEITRVVDSGDVISNYSSSCRDGKWPRSEEEAVYSLEIGNEMEASSIEESIQNAGKGEENAIEKNGGWGKNAETEYEIKWKNQGTEENGTGTIDDSWNGKESDDNSVNGPKEEIVDKLENGNAGESVERGNSGTANEETESGRINEGTQSDSGERKEGAENGNGGRIEEMGNENGGRKEGMENDNGGRIEEMENENGGRNEGMENDNGGQIEGTENGNQVRNEGMENNNEPGDIDGAGVGGEAENGDDNSNSMDGGETRGGLNGSEVMGLQNPVSQYNNRVERSTNMLLHHIVQVRRNVSRIVCKFGRNQAVVNIYSNLLIIQNYAVVIQNIVISSRLDLTQLQFVTLKYQVQRYVTGILAELTSMQGNVIHLQRSVDGNIRRERDLTACIRRIRAQIILSQQTLIRMLSETLDSDAWVS